MSLRIFKRLKILKAVFMVFVVLYVLDYFGAFTHIFEKEYSTDFQYPFEGDINQYVDQLDRGEKPDIPPINIYNYTFILNSDHKCKKEASAPRLVYLVKSALDNFNQRLAIRNSWGFEGRFSDVIIRRVFLLGVSKNDPNIQKRILKEHIKYRDIVQANFIDTYYNNTIKTMMGFKWVMSFCPNAVVYFFSDDDMYVSTKNVLRFIRNPTHYPHYLDNPVLSLDHSRKKRESNGKEDHSNSSVMYNVTINKMHNVELMQENIIFNVNAKNDTNVPNNAVITSFEYRPQSKKARIAEPESKNMKNNREVLQVLDFDLPEDALLWTGYVFVSSPHRHRSSRWYVSLSEYPYGQWPPYVTAGAFVLSQSALRLLYFGSMYTKHFRFDDIFLGIVASKIGLEPFHSDDFHFYQKDYSVLGYRFVIASHGYGNPRELLAVWNEQRSAGNA